MFVKLANFGNDALTFAVTTNQNVEDESETFFFTHHGAMTQRGVNNALQYYDREDLIDIIRLLIENQINVNWKNKLSIQVT